MTPLADARHAQFERLYALARDPLARYLARRAAPDAVEDLFAEVMTVAWRRLEAIPPDGEIAWLYGVARKVLGNHRRAGTRFGRLLERLALVAPREDAAMLPAGPDHDLATAMASLPETDAEVLRLWAWESLTAAEIGIALGITPNAASSRLPRAKARPRARLEADARKIPAVAAHASGVERTEAR